MAERLVDRFFTAASLRPLAEATREIHADFEVEPFMAQVFDAGWPERALMDRMRHVAECLHAALPGDFRATVAILERLGPAVGGFEALVLPEIIGRHGLRDWKTSLPALAWLTRFGSSEFAIREFLIRDHPRVMPWLERWAQDENDHVRRLASEGCRPRLPWAPALPAFKRDPSPILPVLEKLKDDPSEYVRRSVGNNLNDISKDNPEVTLAIAEAWIGESAGTDWILRRACRGLLKSGEPRALRIFGLLEPRGVEIAGLALENPMPRIGDAIGYAFEIVSRHESPRRLRVDLAVDYLKARGHRSRKIFKIAESDFDAPGRHRLQRKLDFQQRSTRRHYPGAHRMTILVNGIELADLDFELKPA